MIPLALFYDKSGNAYIGDGMFIRHIQSPAQLSDVEYVEQVEFVRPIKPYGDASKPVADPLAFGVPVNADTARVVGVAFP